MRINDALYYVVSKTPKTCGLRSKVKQLHSVRIHSVLIVFEISWTTRPIGQEVLLWRVAKTVEILSKHAQVLTSH